MDIKCNCARSHFPSRVKKKKKIKVKIFIITPTTTPDQQYCRRENSEPHLHPFLFLLIPACPPCSWDHIIPTSASSRPPIFSPAHHLNRHYYYFLHIRLIPSPLCNNQNRTSPFPLFLYPRRRRRRDMRDTSAIYVSQPSRLASPPTIFIALHHSPNHTPSASTHFRLKSKLLFMIS